MSASTLTASCPDWADLVARRDATGEDPAGWGEAVSHMDRCDGCRRSALAADPTLVFRRLPRVESSVSEADAMRQAVASLRRAARVTADASSSAPVLPAAAAAGEEGPVLAPWARRLRGLAAALLLTAVGFGVWFTGGDGPSAGTAAGTRAVVGAPELLPEAADPFAGDSPTAEELAAQPVFEGLSRPRAADVYQLGDEDLLVVMVVDETLDI